MMSLPLVMKYNTFSTNSKGRSNKGSIVGDIESTSVIGKKVRIIGFIHWNSRAFLVL
jgi:hypothetical protein